MCKNSLVSFGLLTASKAMDSSDCAHFDFRHMCFYFLIVWCLYDNVTQAHCNVYNMKEFSSHPQTNQKETDNNKGNRTSGIEK